MLTPIFPFWGEEIAAIAFEERESPSNPVEDAGADGDALDELKRRYAAGEIDDEEFERLVAVEDLPDGFASGSADGSEPGLSRSEATRTGRGDPFSDRSTEEETREREPERG